MITILIISLIVNCFLLWLIIQLMGNIRESQDEIFNLKHKKW